MPYYSFQLIPATHLSNSSFYAQLMEKEKKNPSRRLQNGKEQAHLLRGHFSQPSRP